MENWKVGDFVRMTDKERTAGKISAIKGKTIILEPLKTMTKLKNKSVEGLVETEMTLIGKKEEFNVAQIYERLNVYYMSDFIKNYYDFESSNLKLEKFSIEMPILLRSIY